MHGISSISEEILKMKKFFPQLGIARKSHSRWKNRQEQRHRVMERGSAWSPDWLLTHGKGERKHGKDRAYHVVGK